MTATPIPRTLGLVYFADMDISIIDELPPGRMNIETYAVDETKRVRINNFIKKNLDEGRQVFIICPLVEESDIVDAKSAKAHLDLYSKTYLKDYRIEMINGRMSTDEKCKAMQMFENGECDVLISTTVVEVGIDIPNANIMIIENAERFGLAQLHQLRGRVGRGTHQSYCILFFDNSSDEILTRMQIMEKTNDGFIIAEKDYEMRGIGDLLGTRQHGLPNFKIANLYSETKIIEAAEIEANAILNSDDKAEKIKLLDICSQYCKMYNI
jgi:ATP-dependent DNA helicase RecG